MADSKQVLKLKESLRRAEEKQDISKLNNVYNRIEAALVVLRSHTFQEHRTGKIEDLESILTSSKNRIPVLAGSPDSPAEVE